MSGPDVLHLGISAEVRFERSVAPTTEPGSPRSSGTYPLRWHDLDGARAVTVPVGATEGLWLSLRSHEPTALQVVADGRSALTGEPPAGVIGADPQDYVVVPEQRWVDGVRRGDRTAPILGPGAPDHGVTSIRLLARRLRSAVFARWWAATGQDDRANDFGLGAPVRGGAGAGALGPTAPAPDPFGAEAWDPDPFADVEVRLVDPSTW